MLWHILHHGRRLRRRRRRHQYLWHRKTICVCIGWSQLMNEEDFIHFNSIKLMKIMVLLIRVASYNVMMKKEA